MSNPAGWYDDGSGRRRWWDGARWTDHYEPEATAATAVLPGTATGQGSQTVPAHPVAPAPAPPAPSGATSPRGLAITALIVGIVAFLTGLIPVVGVLLGVVAVVFAVIALVRRQPKALAIIAIVLGGIAAVTSVATTAGLATIASNAPRPAPVETEASSAPAPAESDEAEEPSEEAAPPSADGSAANPMPQPYVAEGLFGGEKYSLTARVANPSANAQVAEWNMYNKEAPAGFKYVIVEMTMTGIDPDGVEPSLATFDLQLATAEGNRYDEEMFTVFGEGMPSMSSGPTLYPGNAFTGYSAYIVPESADSFLLYDNANYIALS
jgi:hypothetical protein